LRGNRHDSFSSLFSANKSQGIRGEKKGKGHQEREEGEGWSLSGVHQPFGCAASEGKGGAREVQALTGPFLCRFCGQEGKKGRLFFLPLRRGGGGGRRVIEKPAPASWERLPRLEGVGGKKGKGRPKKGGGGEKGPADGEDHSHRKKRKKEKTPSKRRGGKESFSCQPMSPMGPFSRRGGERESYERGREDNGPHYLHLYLYHQIRGKRTKKKKGGA